MMNDKSCPQTPHHLPKHQGRGSHAAEHVWFGPKPWINNKLQYNNNIIVVMDETNTANFKSNYDFVIQYSGVMNHNICIEMRIIL